ncbi:MAG: signal peptidase II [Erysipelotrichaceae bacterium]|nr:signal peptidase II [Erysipelotrichaceae bacterium]
MKKKHICILLVIFALDQLTKFGAAHWMQLGVRNTLIPNFFHLTYHQNSGAAWSILEGKMWFFYVVSVIALVAMYFFYRHQESAWNQCALALMMGGTIGNFVDRLCFQYVRDFLDFEIFGYDFPVFNIADSALCIGVFLILLDALNDQFQFGWKL